MIDFVWVFLLLAVVYQVKHFLADYIFQTDWMLGKFKEVGWVKPLVAHAGVHAGFTFLIGLAVCPLVLFPYIILAAAFDFTVHFIMDRIKASPNLMGRWQPLNGDQFVAMKQVMAGDPIGAPYPVDVARKRLRANKLFWISLGLDQMVHHLTHYVIIMFFISLIS